jgi:hypothetical protein
MKAHDYCTVALLSLVIIAAYGHIGWPLWLGVLNALAFALAVLGSNRQENE